MDQIVESAAKPASFLEEHKTELIIGAAIVATAGLTWYFMRETDTQYIKKKLKKVAKLVKEDVKEAVKKD